MDDPNQATYAELELEKQFQQSDAFIHRYLQLVGEYGDQHGGAASDQRPAVFHS